MPSLAGRSPVYIARQLYSFRNGLRTGGVADVMKITIEDLNDDDIIAAAAEIRSTVPLALEAMMTEHEADRTTSVMMDAAEARACIATGDMLSRLVEVLRGLRLDPERMRQNLDLGGGLIMAEAVMLNLGQTIGRQHAHDVVYDAAQAAFVEGKSFGMLLAADPRVTAHLSVQQIEALLDPAGYTGLCAEMARDAAARARTLAGEISDA